MATHQIAVIAGDGIGQEVMPEGLKILRTMQEIVPGLHLEFETFPWGSDYHYDHGVMMPKGALKMLAEFDAIYFGAVGDPARVPDHITLNGLILPIRKSFQQYACVRPVQLLPGAPCPLVGKTPVDIPPAMLATVSVQCYVSRWRSAHRLYRSSRLASRRTVDKPGGAIYATAPV
ncbi:D-malate dehydrogenase [decarboxylating] [Candidatus Entotheonellaceae bacterium PAL068K]